MLRPKSIDRTSAVVLSDEIKDFKWFDKDCPVSSVEIVAREKRMNPMQLFQRTRFEAV